MNAPMDSRAFSLTPAGVRAASAWVMQHASHARLDPAAIDHWADVAHIPAGGHADTPLDDAQLAPAAAANLILLVDTLNFCFWSARPVSTTWRGRRVERYTAFAAHIVNAVRADPRWLDPAFWADMTPQQFAALVPTDGELLLIDERVTALRETGRVAVQQWRGQFTHAVEAAHNDAAELATLLASQLGSFRDVSTYAGRPVPILKRAQICAADLSCAWTRRGKPAINGLDKLTAIADYRVPQILRHLGIIRVSADLAARIEREDEIPAHSAEEIELRCAAIFAVEQMRAALADRGTTAAAWEIDFALWEQSHAADVSIKHHRTRTVFY